MHARLDLGTTFPRMELALVGGGTVALPDGLGSRYTVALFYRGHW